MNIMDNEKNKKGVKNVPPRFDNDQLGENASDEFAKNYDNKDPGGKKKKS
jgi:hypothetical protein